MSPTTRSTTVTSDGARLAVYSTGAEDAPVTAILVHGLLESAAAWRLQSHHLAERGYRVVRYDQRAHGHSTPGRDPVTVDRLGADLARVIAETAPEGPLVLAGHSLGGMAIQTLAARHPHLLRARHPHVALVSTACTSVTYAPGHRPLDWATGLARAARVYPICWMPSAADRVRRRLPETHLWALRPDTPRDLSVPPACRKAIHHTASEPIVTLWRSLRAFNTTGALHALNHLRDRVEILTGACDDMIPMPKTQQLTQALPNARLHEPVPGARHRLPTDRNGRAAVTEILTRMCDSTTPSLTSAGSDLLAG
ncbi:alpha/beta hydrolase [Streptomyces sp. NPDC047009]|uniref:alpha/beta fold hydrolase n=1 Tax=Streptomyces sp. NPDC047009 TaxID=3154496 RepID=UPI0033F2092C